MEGFDKRVAAAGDAWLMPSYYVLATVPIYHPPWKNLAHRWLPRPRAERFSTNYEHSNPFFLSKRVLCSLRPLKYRMPLLGCLQPRHSLA